MAHVNVTAMTAAVTDTPCAINAVAEATRIPTTVKTPSMAAPTPVNTSATSNRNATWASAATRSATSAAPARNPENSSRTAATSGMSTSCGEDRKGGLADAWLEDCI